MKFPSSSVLAFVFLTACATLAEAHAYLDHADPKVGSAVPSSPTEVKIWFTSPLIPGRSTLEVVDAKAQEVDKKDVVVDPKDPTVMTVSLPKLTPGTYKVIWHAVNVDTHHTAGTYTFTVTNP